MVVLAIFLGVMAVSMISKWYAPPERVGWREDYAAALADSRVMNKPVLLYFTVDWCGPCQTMRRTVWTEQSVADALNTYIPVRLDAEKHTDLAKRYHVESYPLFLILDPNGSIVRTLDHGEDAEGFIAWLNGKRVE